MDYTEQTSHAMPNNHNDYASAVARHFKQYTESPEESLETLSEGVI